VRAAVGRAFRIPTFTELYYRDPNHQASADLRPERAWGAEAGVDYLIPQNWIASLTLFSRNERNVIDWVRNTPAVRWQTTNIRNVQTFGFETAVRGAAGPDARIEFQYTFVNSNADALQQLSKYVLDFARHSFTSVGDISLPEDFSISQKLNMKRRADGRQYWLMDARISKRFSQVTLWVDGTNLFNTGYQEIRGVDMPGRWFLTGITFGK
jgi:iron complex outermembrane receptor protein